MIRLTVRFSQLEDTLLSEVASLRALVTQCEAYRSLSTTEEEFALALLCKDESNLAEVVAALGQHPAVAKVLNAGEIEIYQQSSYGLEEGRWVPLGEASSSEVIMWPAAGPVSIVIQGAYEPNDSMRELTALEIAETRREPGCIHYAWYENIELPNHFMLLEVWADQRIYDLHWFGRQRSVELRGNSGRVAAEMSRGEASREFYRQQCFELQYGVFVPKCPENYSHTVRWTGR